MKRKSIIFAAAMFLAVNVSFARNIQVDSDQSSVTWVGKKIGGKHDGNVQVKSGQFKLDNDQFVSGSFVIDMTTITNTDLKDGSKEKLEGHLKSDDFFGVEKPEQRPEPPRLVETSWPDGRKLYIANSGRVNFVLNPARQGKMPFFERGVTTQLLPDDGSDRWRRLYQQARREPLFVNE